MKYFKQNDGNRIRDTKKVFSPNLKNRRPLQIKSDLFVEFKVFSFGSDS